MFPFFAWETAFHGLPPFSWKIFAAVGYVAIFPSIVAYLCWNKGVSVIGPNHAGIMVTLIPVFVAILAVPFLDEKLHYYHLVGMLTIFSGMILFNREELFPKKQEVLEVPRRRAPQDIAELVGAPGPVEPEPTKRSRV